MEVLSTYVDSFHLEESAPLSEHRDNRLVPEMPIKVTRGKHGGKQGILSLLRRYVSVIVEDHSEVQVMILIIKTIREDKILTSIRVVCA